VTIAPGHPTGHPSDRMKQETTMLKTLSAALVAVSMLAAPAMATTIVKTHRGHVANTVIVKPSIARAHAQMVVVKKVRPHRHMNAHRHGHKVVVIKKHRHH
jgi:hypothetical protein